VTSTPDEAAGFRRHARHQPGVEKVYANERIEVNWEPAFCIHAAECIRHLPGVFDPRRRPWIDVEDATPDEIADVVLRCPTGALHSRRLDGGPQEEEPEEITIEEQLNGPLYVRGRVRIRSADGEYVREDTRVALCRCGRSSNKPFCDGTHRLVGFRTDDRRRRG